MNACVSRHRNVTKNGRKKHIQTEMSQTKAARAASLEQKITKETKGLFRFVAFVTFC